MKTNTQTITKYLVGFTNTKGKVIKIDSEKFDTIESALQHMGKILFCYKSDYPYIDDSMISKFAIFKEVTEVKTIVKNLEKVSN